MGTKISSLPSAGTLTGTEIVVMDQAGNTVTAPSGNMGIWVRTAAEIAAGVTPTNYAYPPGDTRRYDTLAHWALILGSVRGRVVGVNNTTVSVSIPSNSIIDFDPGASIAYTGNVSGTPALVLNSVLHVTMNNPFIDVSGDTTGSAIGIQMNGAWHITLNEPVIKAKAGVNSQIGIEINSSQVGNLNFGAFVITINSPKFCADNGFGQLQYGILSQQTAGDGVQVTHLFVRDGWINTGSTAAIKLTQTATFRIEGTTLEGCADGVQYGSNCHSGFLSLGEVGATGYAINPLDATCAHIGFVYPSADGTYASGYVNTTNSTPDYIGYAGELRMYPNGLSSSGYGVSYKAQFSSIAALVESVGLGGPLLTIRNVNGNLSGTGIHQLTRTASISASGIAGTNLRGTATFAAGTTVGVAFGNAEPDANYLVYLSPVGNPDGFLWPTSQTTTGFTINCSVSTSIQVNWFLVR